MGEIYFTTRPGCDAVRHEPIKTVFFGRRATFDIRCRLEHGHSGEHWGRGMDGLSMVWPRG